MAGTTSVTGANRRIAELVQEHELVAPEVLAGLVRQANQEGTALIGVLVEHGVQVDDTLLTLLADHLGIDYWDGDTGTIDQTAVDRLPGETARPLGAIPIRVEGDHLVVAVADPLNETKAQALAGAIGHPVRLVLTRVDRIARLLDFIYAAPVEIQGHGVSGLRIDGLLAELVGRGGSDLHLTLGSPPRIRVDGELVPLPGRDSLTPEELRDIIIEMLNAKGVTTLEDNWELDLSHPVAGLGRFRTSVFFQRGVLGAVFRAVPTEITDLETLGLPGPVRDFADLSRGLVLVTGPTGSGKTTTLASLVDVINTKRSSHIMTIEDPIEFVHSHKRSLVNQREVGADTKAFSTALRQVLRQDPDVILVGEMRDLETISATVTAAETGHLVFATLHTANAPQSIDRIIDVFPAHQQQQIRMQLASSIQGIISQQLVPLIDGGRTVAAEVMVATPAIRAMIRDAKVHQIHSAMQAGARFGMQTMDSSLVAHVKSGAITSEIGLERCHDPGSYEALMRDTE
jgi:twitching motility protein PilT